MGIKEWSVDTKNRYKYLNAKNATTSSAQELWAGFFRRFGKHVWNYGEHVFEQEWDVLLVLDTCRWDVLSKVTDEYDYLSDYSPEKDTINSVASRSPEWVDKTFNSNYSDILETMAYVTSNPHSEDIENADSLHFLDEVWKYGWESKIENVPPETVTDRAIDVWRNNSSEKMIVHYMQPHQPYRKLAEEHPEWFYFVGEEQNAEKDDLKINRSIWERFRDGEIEHQTLWEAYKDNLRWVLDSVNTLIKNINAESIVITADHGEAFGEWGCYGHYSHVPIPQLKKVPWFSITGNDTKQYKTKVTKNISDIDDSETKERLRFLGYLE